MNRHINLAEKILVNSNNPVNRHHNLENLRRMTPMTQTMKNYVDKNQFYEIYKI